MNPLTKEQSDIVKSLIHIVFKDKSQEEQAKITEQSIAYNATHDVNHDDLYSYVCYFWLNKIPDKYVYLIPQNIEPEIMALRKVIDVELKTEHFGKQEQKSTGTRKKSNLPNSIDVDFRDGVEKTSSTGTAE